MKKPKVATSGALGLPIMTSLVIHALTTLADISIKGYSPKATLSSKITNMSALEPSDKAFEKLRNQETMI